VTTKTPAGAATPPAPGQKEAAEPAPYTFAQNLSLIWRFRAYFTPYLLPAASLLGLALLQADLTVTGAGAVKGLLDHLAGNRPEEGPAGVLSGPVLRTFADGGNALRLALLAALFLVLSQCVFIVTQQVRSVISHRFRQRLQHRIVSALSYETAETRSLRTSGGTNEIFTSDAPGLSAVLIFGILGALEEIVRMGMIAFGVLQVPNGLQLLLVLAPMAILFQTGVVGLFLTREARMNERSQAAVMRLRSQTIGFFDVLGRLVYFRGERSESAKLLAASREAGEANRRFQLLSATRSSVSNIFTELTLPLVALVVIAAPAALRALGFSSGSLVITAGDVVAASALLMQFVGNIAGVIDTPAMVASYSPNLRRLDEVLRVPEPGAAPAELETLRNRGGPLRVELRDLTYAYPGASAPVLSDISLDIPAGARVGIIGGSGSGKSTLARLLLGDLRPASGQLLFDGLDVSSWHLWWRRELVGFLPAEQGFLRGTLEENVLFGRSHDEIHNYEAALQASGVAAIAEDKKADGGMQLRIDRNVEDFLSTGQRRKVGIARLLVGKQRLWIFDEPGSGLDPRSMGEVATALNRATQGVTSLIITHDPDVFVTDLNIFLLQGTVADVGTHAELLERNPAYARLVARLVHARQEEEKLGAAPRTTPAAPAVSPGAASGKVKVKMQGPG
jgi:ABC-type multidrug transport system fused ATPase/permease subunit